ncbi:zf-TFIIB domain-containing protein [bacterium]|nr:zf-TFIIB domain-containing protein [bacterium]
MSIKCPRCNQLLVNGEYADIPLKMCEECDGIILPQPKLVKFLEAFAEDTLSDVDIDMKIPETEIISTPVKCPACNMMMENYGYMGSNDVKIDSCFRCQHLWLDSHDLDVMATLYARANLRQDTERKKREDQNRKEAEIKYEASKNVRKWIKKRKRRRYN